jgi:hypothetical protein
MGAACTSQPSRQSGPNFCHVYHERQKGRLCGKHAVNNLLQQHAMSHRHFNRIAKELDDAEMSLIKNPRKKQLQYWVTGGKQGWRPEKNANRTADGNFSIQVLQQALIPFGLRLLAPGNSELQGPSAPMPSGFLLHGDGHWSAIRRLEHNGTWVDLDSNLERPQLLSDLELSCLKAGRPPRRGGLIFCVIGDLPACPRQGGRNITQVPVTPDHNMAFLSPESEIQIVELHAHR